MSEIWKVVFIVQPLRKKIANDDSGMIALAFNFSPISIPHTFYCLFIIIISR